MRKPVRNLLWGAGTAAVLVVTGLAFYFLREARVDPQKVLESLARATPPGRLVIEYPLDGTLFPPDISAPAFHWKDENTRSSLWLVTMEFPDGGGRINDFAPQSEWRPRPRVWEEIKSRSVAGPAVVTVVGLNDQTLAEPLSAGRVTIRTSADQVEAPLFYREVNLPFADAVKDPTTIRRSSAGRSSRTPRCVSRRASRLSTR